MEPDKAAPLGQVGLRSLPRKQVTFTLAGVMLAMFLSSLDQNIVGTAMPKIVADLGGFAQYTWLTTSYLLTSTVVLPITGRITDMYGRKPFYLAGLGIFIAGSVFSGLSQTMGQIIFARGFQGIGAGVMMSNAFSVIGDLYPPAERGKIQGFVAAVIGVSSILGPVVGGFITDTLSWHWIFFINVPLGLATLGLFVLFYPHFRPDARKHSIDWAGVAALTLCVAPLLLALSWGGVDYPWGSAQVIGMFILAAVALLAFVLIELRSKEPLMPLSLFKDRIVSISLAATFFSGLGMFGGIVFVPLFFQGVLGASATSSGSFLTPMMLGLVVGSAASGQALTRGGGHYKVLGAIGLALIAAGMVLLSRMNVETSYARAVFNIVWVGIGLGITFPVYQIVVQNTVPYELLGTASSAVPFFRAIGGAVGLAIFGSVVNHRFASEFLAGLPESLKAAIPQQFLDSVTGNAQALLNPEAATRLKAVFDQMGDRGAALYQQTVLSLKVSLSTALSEVFLLCSAFIVASFVINWFIKEIPLRKAHSVDTSGRNGPPAA
ncbi:MAG: MFS transporter [Chloroflexi bacterium]|nr:MFS transporter [Chloroflexota bacterium]